MERGQEVWAGISADHLSPIQKRDANCVKEELMEIQKGRKMLCAPFETGEVDQRSYIVDTLGKFNIFVDGA